MPDREFGESDGPSTPLLNAATRHGGLRASYTDREDAMSGKKKYDSSWDKGAGDQDLSAPLVIT